MTAHNTPVSTPSGPSAGLGGQDATQETQDATEAAQERVERAGKVRARKGPVCPECVSGDWWENCADCDAIREQAEKDATIAELRAEVERLRGEVGQYAVAYPMTLARAEAAETESDRLREALREALSTFAYPTHPGRECRQSGHVPIETLRRWQAVLDAPKDTTAP